MGLRADPDHTWPGVLRGDEVGKNRSASVAQFASDRELNLPVHAAKSPGKAEDDETRNNESRREEQDCNELANQRDAVVDEESFNPGPSPHDYSSTQPPETIGVDNSWTVLHIPLNHVLLSKPPQRFKLDPSVLEQKVSQRSHPDPNANSAMLHERPSTE